MMVPLPLFSISNIPVSIFWLCIALLLSATVVTGSDLEREKRLSDEFAESILDGDLIWLKSEGHNFASIHTEADDSRRAVIILHGRGFHPDWIDTVQPLRVGLIDHSWNTLSIQLPVLEKQAKYYDYVPLFAEAKPRIKAAIEYLKRSGNKLIVLIAHSCGVHMSMPFLSEDNGTELTAYVGLGMGATDYRQTMSKPFPLDNIKIPVLDLYGEHDYPAVQRMAPDRARMIRMANNPLSKQAVLPGADHYFTDKGDELVDRVANWLDTISVP
ncbi:MAG: pimeloyl-ACP methyl ester carboxylesterase [Gammaproteobacteria bacterium]|jgi:pimeloyl-ACP methyl ester carboxylesterase